MRLGKLYIKISLSFLGLLCLTLFVIFGLFVFLPGKHFITRLEQYTETKVLIVKEVIEDKIRSAPTDDLSKNEDLKDFISNFGKILGAKVWVQQQNGAVPVKSFPGDIPAVEERLKEWRSTDYGSFRLYRLKKSDFYAVIPVEVSEGGIGIHILFAAQEPHGPEYGFALGLVIIGLIIALLIIPISKFIIKPLKGLSHSALKIAEGDLAHRAEVRSRDEIGDLCRTFNHMADKVEMMIKGGRELTANVSHELRTPLARIRIAEEILREKLEGGNYQDLERYLNDILEDIEELDKLIGRILDLSKLDIQESVPKFETMDPVGLIKELLERFEPVFQKKELSLKTDLSFNPPFRGDREALHTALLNILDNASKFTPKRGDLIVSMCLKGDRLEISVTNSFERISDDDLAKIFKPFYRMSGSKQAGSGLGLAITQKIVERHGGEIRAFNSEEGLEIRVRLPVNPK